MLFVFYTSSPFLLLGLCHLTSLSLSLHTSVNTNRHHNLDLATYSSAPMSHASYEIARRTTSGLRSRLVLRGNIQEGTLEQSVGCSRMQRFVMNECAFPSRSLLLILLSTLKWIARWTIRNGQLTLSLKGMYFALFKFGLQDANSMQILLPSRPT
ncbi:hypothetical protein BKA70DRAFT_48289 [Coprinopsis sp. MPI-PUGE-AT-0042]|nr:hypothetical protein BKA70DRAFT_48289 [Coprinopsis sp. MPI-PUGE-AT-0042]